MHIFKRMSSEEKKDVWYKQLTKHPPSHLLFLRTQKTTYCFICAWKLLWCYILQSEPTYFYGTRNL